MLLDHFSYISRKVSNIYCFFCFSKCQNWLVFFNIMMSVSELEVCVGSQITEGDKVFRCILMFSLTESENGHCVSMLSLLLGFQIIKTQTRQWLRGWWCLLCVFFLLNRWATCVTARAPSLTFLALTDMLCFTIIKVFS